MEENQEGLPGGGNEEMMGTPLVQDPAQPQRPAVLEEEGLVAQYSNFCFTAGTREGILLGFGLHDWQGKDPVRVGAKVEMSYYNAKKLLASLQQVIQRHEEVFGTLEIDVNRRIQVRGQGTGDRG